MEAFRYSLDKVVRSIFARTVTKKLLFYTLVQNRANICQLILVDATESKTATITKHHQRAKKRF
jgi:hypothetical protein